MDTPDTFAEELHRWLVENHRKYRRVLPDGSVWIDWAGQQRDLEKCITVEVRTS